MSVSAVSSDSPEQTLRCARHPGTETVLRCGRCETPICPRCLVATPVGARCPTCAQVKRFALLLKPRDLVRAVAFGLGAAALGTIVLSFIPPFGFIGLLLFAGLGYVVGEAVAVGANRKRARELGPTAVAVLVVGYDLGRIILVLLSGRPFGPELLVLPLVNLLGALPLLVGLLIAALLAWMRVR